MHELTFMSLDTFNENKAAVLAEVTTILSAKGKTRSRFRYIAVYEKCCGQLLAEVFLTSFGHVVAYRTGGPGYLSRREEATGTTKALVVGLRHGETDIQPLVGSPQQPFMVTTRHPLTTVDGRHIYTFPLWSAYLIARLPQSSLLAFR